MAYSNPFKVPQNRQSRLTSSPVPYSFHALSWTLRSDRWDHTCGIFSIPWARWGAGGHSSCLIKGWRSRDCKTAPDPRSQINFQYIRYLQSGSPPARSCSLIIRLEWFAINTSKHQLTVPKSLLINGGSFFTQQWEPCGWESTCVNW